MKSMTGFGRGTAIAGNHGLTVEFAAVNRRSLETSFSLPREWQVLERDLAEILRQGVQRGKVHANVQVDAGQEGQGFRWDQSALDATLARLGELARREAVAWPPDADALIRLISLHKVDSNLPPPEDVREALTEAGRAALLQLNEMRAREGAHLAKDLEERCSRLRSFLQAAAKIVPETVTHYREILFQRLKSAGLEIDLDDERVLKEIALFADRCDTTEEMTRLESHLQQFLETLHLPGDPAIGRKLEFITQEINREFNTIGAKANNVEVSRLVIEAKNEIERIREQVQNVE